MEQAQDYSFNKSHAACYALISYRTAWLRANHPKEYMAALISSVMNTKDKVPFYVNACDELGIEVLPPDVNTSQIDFAVVEGKIRFGLNAVKNVGESACREIVRAREEGGPFESIWDFTERVDPQVSNKRALESLIKAGALDSTGASRKGMLECLEHALSWGQKQQADKLLGQGSIFDLGDAAGETAPRHHPAIPAEEYEKGELLHMEKESLGLYVSEHPLSGIRDQLRRKTDCALSELERRRDGEIVVVGGIVSAIKQLTTKKGEPMVFVGLEDVTGSVEVVAFNSVYAQARDLIVQERILVVKGRVDHKQQGETKLIALEITPFEAVLERREVRLKVDARIAPAGLIRELADVVGRYPGEAPGVRRGRHLVRPEAARARPEGAADPGLLRRGEGAARRGRGLVAARKPEYVQQRMRWALCVALPAAVWSVGGSALPANKPPLSRADAKADIAHVQSALELERKARDGILANTDATLSPAAYDLTAAGADLSSVESDLSEHSFDGPNPIPARQAGRERQELEGRRHVRLPVAGRPLPWVAVWPAAKTSATSQSSLTSTTGRRRSSTRCSGRPARSARTRT